MRFIKKSRGRFFAAVAALVLASGVGVAYAAAGSGHGSRGTDEFGMTAANFEGHSTSFTYTKGFYCDTSVSAKSTSKCEAGAKWKKPPAKHFDPLYILVPLGFTPKASSMECPNGLVCVDHPATIDLTRLEPALKPLYPDLSKAQLLKALANFATPGHQHYIDDLNHGKKEWWDVQIVGVTDKAEYQKIVESQSASFLLSEAKAGKTTPAIPTNLFLFFSVQDKIS